MAFKNYAYEVISTFHLKLNKKRYSEEKSLSKVQWKFHENYGRNWNLPNNKTILRWVQDFQLFMTSGTVNQLKCQHARDGQFN